MERKYQPYFKIYIGDYYLKLGHPILFVTSYHDIGGYGAEYFGFFTNRSKIFSKRTISNEQEVNGLVIGSDFLFEEAFKMGKGDLLNHLGNQISDYSNIPVSFKEFELVKKEESEFFRLSLFTPSVSEVIKNIITQTNCYQLQNFITKVIVSGNFRFSDI
ncbi:MAG: hypothetical protein WDZ80_02470 [Candidatus Paceibacterota bacterium]